VLVILQYRRKQVAYLLNALDNDLYREAGGTQLSIFHFVPAQRRGNGSTGAGTQGVGHGSVTAYTVLV